MYSIFAPCQYTCKPINDAVYRANYYDKLANNTFRTMSRASYLAQRRALLKRRRKAKFTQQQLEPMWSKMPAKQKVSYPVVIVYPKNAVVTTETLSRPSIYTISSTISSVHLNILTHAYIPQLVHHMSRDINIANTTVNAAPIARSIDETQESDAPIRQELDPEDAHNDSDPEAPSPIVESPSNLSVPLTCANLERHNSMSPTAPAAIGYPSPRAIVANINDTSTVMSDHPPALPMSTEIPIVAAANVMPIINATHPTHALSDGTGSLITLARLLDNLSLTDAERVLAEAVRGAGAASRARSTSHASSGTYVPAHRVLGSCRSDGRSSWSRLSPPFLAYA